MGLRTSLGLGALTLGYESLEHRIELANALAEIVGPFHDLFETYGAPEALDFDNRAGLAKANDQDVELTSREFEQLSAFDAEPGVSVTLQRLVWLRIAAGSEGEPRRVAPSALPAGIALSNSMSIYLDEFIETALFVPGESVESIALPDMALSTEELFGEVGPPTQAGSLDDAEDEVAAIEEEIEGLLADGCDEDAEALERFCETTRQLISYARAHDFAISFGIE